MQKAFLTPASLLDLQRAGRKHSQPTSLSRQRAVLTCVVSAGLCLLAFAYAQPIFAQSTDAVAAAPESAASAPESVVRWSSSLPEAAGKTVELQFDLYQNSSGGVSLWSEIQTVKVSADGKYTVLLGVTTPEGLPATLFSGGEARWVEVKLSGANSGGNSGDNSAVSAGGKTPRSLLAAVPYAFKSVDAASLGGRAASDYVTREELQANNPTNSTNPAFTPMLSALTGTGTTNYIPVWTGAATEGNSTIYQSGTNVGINTTTPQTTFDVNGTFTARSDMRLNNEQVATSSAPRSSPLGEFVSSSYSSTLAAAVPESFAWQAVGESNNTAAPTGILELLSGSGATYLSPTPTGFSLAANGEATFVKGQGYPLYPQNAATAATSYNSPSLQWESNAYSSSSSASVAQNFTLRAVASGNDTASPTGNLELFTGSGSAASNPTFTGLKIAPTGIITFASGQNFASGITSVTGTSPITASLSGGLMTVGVNLSTLTTDLVPGLTTALETPFDSVYAQLAGGNAFAGWATFGDTTTTGYVEAYQVTGPGYAAFLGWGTNGSVGTFGDSDTGYGVQGVSDSGLGVFGQSSSPALGQAGVMGQLKGTFSDTYATVAGTADVNSLAAGVWGDGAADSSLSYTAGVVGTAGVGYGGVFFNNNTASQAIFAENVAEGSSGSDPMVIEAYTSGDYAYNIYSSAGGLNARGVDAIVNGNGSIGVYGESDGAINGSATPIGVKGLTSGADANGVVADATGAGGYGIYAHANGAQDTVRYAPIGVYGLSESGTGVLGINTGSSSTYNTYKTGFSPSVTGGVWGDTSSDGADFQAGGIVGTADNNTAAFFVNNSSGQATVYASNSSSGGTGLFKVFKATTPKGTCGIGDGDLSCTGQMKSLVATSGGAKTVETYAMQSPENWIEDFGTGTMERGVAVVKIDPAFAETVTGDASYHVFLTPRGDSEGLYVINASPTGFEVRESKGGTSSLSFDYRIVAKRRGYETQRLTDVTERFNAEKADIARRTPKNIVPASKGEVEANMVEPHPPVSRLAKAGHPAPEIKPKQKPASIHLASRLAPGQTGH